MNTLFTVVAFSTSSALQLPVSNPFFPVLHTMNATVPCCTTRVAVLHDDAETPVEVVQISRSVAPGLQLSPLAFRFDEFVKPGSVPPQPVPVNATLPATAYRILLFQ